MVGDVQHRPRRWRWAAFGLVWLIACANASNLLIARVTSRRRELAVRAALGASRDRVVRYLLAESALLAFGAALVGLAVAWAGVRMLQNFGAAYFPRTGEIALDGLVLWVLVALTVRQACSLVSCRRCTAAAASSMCRCGRPAGHRRETSPCVVCAARSSARSSRLRRRCWSSLDCSS